MDNVLQTYKSKVLPVRKKSGEKLFCTVCR